MINGSYEVAVNLAHHVPFEHVTISSWSYKVLVRRNRMIWNLTAIQNLTRNIKLNKVRTLAFLMYAKIKTRLLITVQQNEDIDLVARKLLRMNLN